MKAAYAVEASQLRQSTGRQPSKGIAAIESWRSSRRQILWKRAVGAISRGAELPNSEAKRLEFPTGPRPKTIAASRDVSNEVEWLSSNRTEGLP